MCVCIMYVRSLPTRGFKTWGLAHEVFLPTTSNQPFVPFIPPSFLLTFRSHSLMHLKNIAYTMFYASFNRLLWAVHTKHIRIRTYENCARQYIRKKTCTHLFLALSSTLFLHLFHSLSLFLSLSLALPSVGSTLRLLCKTFVMALCNSLWLKITLYFIVHCHLDPIGERGQG